MEPESKKALTSSDERETLPLDPDHEKTQDPVTTIGTSPHSFLREGSTLGSYLLVRKLGAGGFGQVWEAEDSFGRRVALKILTGHSSDPAHLQRFLQEGRTAASLNHPNCVFVFSTEEIAGLRVIAMELLTGGTLQDLLKQETRLSQKKAVDATLDLIEGLDAAWQLGIIHRDIKPSNCFLDSDGSVKIGDFGLARSTEEDSGITASGVFLGTPSFASPEQVRGRDMDFRSDMFSLGTTLYVLLTGKPPFEGKSATEVLARITSEPPTPFTQHNAQVPRGLQDVILRMLEKDRSKRYKSYADLRSALLPYSSRGLRISSLGLRFGAHFIDGMFLWPVGFLLERWIAEMIFLRKVLFVIIELLYYTLSEARFGRTPGKYLFGLRVMTADGLTLPWKQAWVRSGAFVFFNLAIPSIVFYVPIEPGWLAFLISAAADFSLLITMRKANGFAGLHEWISGTRVFGIRESETYVLEEQSKQALQPFSETFGPYRTLGLLYQNASGALILANDDVLRRRIWIYRRAADGSADMPHQQRPGRLRWIQGVRGRSSWDAYQAPAGAAILECSPLGWKITRQVLAALACELDARLKEDDQQSICAEQLWLDQNGRAKVLDFPAMGTSVSEDLPIQQWRRILHQALILCMDGRLVPVAELNGVKPRAPYPEHARNLIESLCGTGFDGLSPIGVRDALAPTEGRIHDVSRLRRSFAALLPVLAPLTVLVLIVASFYMIRTMLPEHMRVIIRSQDYVSRLQELQKDNTDPGKEKQEALQKILSFCYGKYLTGPRDHRYFTVPTNDAVVLKQALQKYPDVSDREYQESQKLLAEDMPTSPNLFGPQSKRMAIMMFLLIPAVMAPFSILLAFAFRGSFALRLVGLGVQKRTGEMAGRFRCSFRSLVIWIPSLLLLALVPRAYSLFIPAICVLVVLIAGVVSIFIHPERGIADRIASTRVVPL